MKIIYDLNSISSYKALISNEAKSTKYASYKFNHQICIDNSLYLLDLIILNNKEDEFIKYADNYFKKNIDYYPSIGQIIGFLDNNYEKIHKDLNLKTEGEIAFNKEEFIEI